MKKIGYVVIGSGFGDEGKGLITDFLARKFTNSSGAPVNVRFNGGAQAGHTVVDGDKRHVFGHFGAATFAGSPTFLSSKFIFNHYALNKEIDALNQLRWHPRIRIHPTCEVTTIFDMVLNGLQELARSNNRHGSCGLGINETVTRALAGYSFTVDDLTRPDMESKLQAMWYDWWYPRYSDLNLVKVNDNALQSLFMNRTSHQEGDNLRRAARSIGHCISHLPDYSDHRKDVVIFEGAQGLQLDEHLGKFPNVTRSITGLPSALLAAYEVGVTELTPIYVTRAYKTRHGAGFLEHEGESICANSLVDQTNVTGQWQGQFRYAPLDLAVLRKFIDLDERRSVEIARLYNINVKPARLAVTCLDQVGDQVAWYGERGEHFLGKPESLLNHLDNIALVDYISYGPSAKDVSEHHG